MSKTRKVRHARRARDEALTKSQEAAEELARVRAQTHQARVALENLIQLTAGLGQYNLFRAAVHGIGSSDRRVVQHEFEMVEHNLTPLKVGHWLHSNGGRIVLTRDMMRIIEAEVQAPTANRYGHIMRVWHGRKQVLAIDAQALTVIPESMLASELGEYVAEALKEGANA